MTVVHGFVARLGTCRHPMMGAPERSPSRKTGLPAIVTCVWRGASMTVPPWTQRIVAPVVTMGGMRGESTAGRPAWGKSPSHGGCLCVIRSPPSIHGVRGERRVKLFAVDEHEIFCRGIVACLVALPDVESVGSAGSASAALAQPELQAADVAIVDPRMTDGLTLMRQLSGAPGPALIACVERGGATRIVLLAAIDAGATGFLDRLTLTPDRLEASVRAAARGAGVMAPELLETLYRGVAERAGSHPPPRP